MAEQSDFISMQQDAMRRVREMQQRSRSFVEPPEASEMTSPEDRPPIAGDGKPNNSAAAPYEKSGKPLFSFAGIDIDEEKALIALMIYILYKNKADMKLLLGLGYLLL